MLKNNTAFNKDTFRRKVVHPCVFIILDHFSNQAVNYFKEHFTQAAFPSAYFHLESTFFSDLKYDMHL